MRTTTMSATTTTRHAPDPAASRDSDWPARPICFDGESSLHQSLVALAEAMDGCRSSSFAEIGRQGVMRCHGCAVVLQQLRIVGPVRSKGQTLPHRRVKLGRIQTEYMVVTPVDTDWAEKLEETRDSLSTAWRDVLLQTDLAKVVKELTRNVITIRDVMTPTQETKSSYVVAHLVRKFFFVLSAGQRCGHRLGYGDGGP